MNRSRSETFHEQNAASSSTSAIERVENSPEILSTPTSLNKRLKGSWHGEKVRRKSSGPRTTLGTSLGICQQKRFDQLSKSEWNNMLHLPGDSQLKRLDRLSKSERSNIQNLPGGRRRKRSDRLSINERNTMLDISFTSPAASSEAGIRRILTPNLLSPTTPSKTRTERRTKSLAVVGSPPLEKKPNRRSSELINKIKEVAVPSIYKCARKCMWDEMSAMLLNSSCDTDYVYKKDGTTALHMAVMSRTGYITAFKSSSKEFAVAPLELIEKLLQVNADVAKIQCTLNGYTPLTYACLVCNSTYDVEGSAAMVRLLLKYCPESINLFTKDGLSPVDIHVVSYSHHHKEKEEGLGLGRTSASVLRTLLTHNPDLANNRLVDDKIKGPMELLYKCNIQAFSQAVMDEIYDEDDENGTITSDFTIPERRQKVVDTVKKWWIWTWTVMILKYGSKKYRQRGAQFSALHAAVMQPSCATPILSITVYAFPRQIKQSILDKNSLENLPLHAVCSWPSGPKDKNASQSLLATRKSQAITRVIEEYPLAIKVTNGTGETALELAAKTGTTWDGGIRRLVKAYPRALRIQSKRTGLYPFMTAATNAAADCDCEQRERQALRTIYGLLRSNPKVLIQLLKNS